jgi:hypothetical protein
MNLSQISKWLRKTPQPATIIVDDAKRIDVGTRGGRWTEVARSIEALGASKLTALDGQGNVLRAITIADDDDDDSEKKGKHDHPSACPTCGVSLDQFAALLSDAYLNGSKSQKDAYHSIFEENTKLVRLLADRLGALEMAWQKSLQNHARMITDMAEADAARTIAEASAGDDGVQGLVSALASGMMEGQAAHGHAQPNGRKGAGK